MAADQISVVQPSRRVRSTRSTYIPNGRVAAALTAVVIVPSSPSAVREMPKACWS
jgi:hypothetical protein